MEREKLLLVPKNLMFYLCELSVTISCRSFSNNSLSGPKTRRPIGHYIFPIVTKVRLYKQRLIKLPSIKFRETFSTVLKL
jgi:hypothetical protein